MIVRSVLSGAKVIETPGPGSVSSFTSMINEPPSETFLVVAAGLNVTPAMSLSVIFMSNPRPATFT